MCLIPIYGGPREIPLIESSALYQRRKTLGTALQVVASIHLLIGVSWIVVYHFMLGIIDLLLSQIGLWSVNKQSQNIGFILSYGVICVINAVFSVVMFAFRMSDVKEYAWLPLTKWQREMELITVCVAFFVYVSAAVIAFFLVLANAADQPAMDEALRQANMYRPVSAFDPFGRPPRQYQQQRHDGGGSNDNKSSSSSSNQQQQQQQQQHANGDVIGRGGADERKTSNHQDDGPDSMHDDDEEKLIRSK